MSKHKLINTERLCLRSISDSDIDDMIALLANDEISKTFMIPDFKSYDEAVNLFERLKLLSESDEHFVYGIYLENRMIGFINDVDISENEVELGYVIHPSQKNNGFATEVLRAAIREIFASGYSVIKAGAFEENIASIRVMEKCGMMQTSQDDNVEYRGKVHHCIYYSKENDLLI